VIHGLQGCSIFDTLGFTLENLHQTLTFLARGSAKMLGAAGATVAAGYAATVTWLQIGWSMVGLPSGNLTQPWKITIFNGKTHYKWPFSIAMLNYQRVSATCRGCKLY